MDSRVRHAYFCASICAKIIRGVEVSESNLKVCDALIGMDVISLGDMKVTNKPTTKFIFRIPAEGDTPLVAES